MIRNLFSPRFRIRKLANRKYAVQVQRAGFLPWRYCSSVGENLWSKCYAFCQHESHVKALAGLLDYASYLGLAEEEIRYE